MSSDKTNNILLLIIRFLRIFFLFCYLRWALLIDLVSGLSSDIASLVLLIIYIVNPAALLVGGIVADKFVRKLTLLLGAIFSH
ncbi:MAG: hypothetical protein GXO10_06705 [Crenarchaeota archaeon]|nr:hypothetical protein [Thermoproteota archaeon]